MNRCDDPRCDPRETTTVSSFLVFLSRDLDLLLLLLRRLTCVDFDVRVLLVDLPLLFVRVDLELLLVFTLLDDFLLCLLDELLCDLRDLIDCVAVLLFGCCCGDVTSPCASNGMSNSNTI